MSSSVELKALGLNFQPNQLSVPPGSLSEASNVIIRRSDVIESRRGFKLYGNSFGTSSDRAKQLFAYKNTILRHYATTLQFDRDNLGDFLSFSGDFLEAQTGLRTKSVEANGNLYLTSSTGIRKISATSSGDFTIDSGFITLAGGVKATDISTSLVPSNTGFLLQDSAVAYRVLWLTKDLNGNLIQGTPSSRSVVYNFQNSLMLQDYTNIAGALDNLNTTGSIINYGQFIQNYGVNANSSPSELQIQLQALGSQLDFHIEYASDSAPTASVPLQIASITLNNSLNLATVLFSGSPTLSNYFSVGDKIFLTSTSSVANTTPIDGFTLSNFPGQTFNSTTDVDINHDTITIAAHGYKSGDPVQFTGTLPVGINAGTTYYIINPTTNTFQVSNTKDGNFVDITATAVGTGTVFKIATGNINGVQTITDVGTTPFTIQFSTTATGSVSVTASKIISYEFENINATIGNGQPVSLNDLNVTIPSTNQQLGVIQDAITRYISGLQGLPTGVVTAPLNTTFLAPLETIMNANVRVDISIPEGAQNPNYFFQIYRSDQVQATGSSNLNDLIPDDEMRLVYEAFPTSAELIAKEIIVIDSTPDAFRGANLYTNAFSGEGIAQANDTPPFALDINRFKGSVFYANTKTKQRQLLTLLGVSNIIADYNNLANPGLLITNGTITNRYTFQLGIQQISKVVTDTYANTSNHGFIILYSANNINEYFFRLNKTTPLSNPVGYLGGSAIKYTINVAAANATAGATYQDINGNTYSVINTIVGGISLNLITSNLTPLLPQSGTLTKVSGTGDATIAITSYTVFYNINQILIDIDISDLTGGTAAQLAQRLSDKVNIELTDFTSTVLTGPAAVQITNVNEGITFAGSVNSLGGSWTYSTTASGNGENVATNQILLSNLVSAAQAIDETARSIVRVINRNPNETIFAYYISGTDTIPGEMLFESRNLNSSPFYLLASSLNVGSSFSPDLSPLNIKIDAFLSTGFYNNDIRTVTPHGLTVGEKIIIFELNGSTIPDYNGIGIVSHIGDSTHFSIGTTPTTFSSTTSAVFIPLTEAIVSTDEEKKNRIYYSKKDEPEAVPIINFFDVGSLDKAILRIFPLRDSLFIFKEDGLYRISGEQIPFVLSLFDGSCLLLASDSVALSNNIIYCWTSQGISTVSEAGVKFNISRPIDTDILKKATNQYTNFKTATWGIGYESDNSYLLSTIINTSDTEATLMYRYSTLTNTWTTFDKSVTCGIVNIYGDDRLYLGAGDTDFIEQERKNYNRYDYADREFIITLPINGYFNTNLIVSNTANIAIGDVLTQDQYVTKFLFNGLLNKLDTDPGIPTHHNYFSTLAMNAGDDGYTKLLALADKLDIDLATGTTFHNLVFGLGTNFLNVKTSFNNVITAMNADTTLAYSNYTQINDITSFEVIITNVNNSTKTLTVNLALDYLQGDMTIYKSINSEITYCPITMEDALSLKHFRESTIMFDNKAFTNSVLSFATDLLPAFIPIPFNGDGNGIFGNSKFFGSNFFGGLGNSAPFRTLIPRDCQRCRYILVKYSHNIAREQFGLYGITLTGELTSTRAYR